MSDPGRGGTAAWARRLLAVASAGYAVSAVLVLLLGGYSLRYGPIRLSSWRFAHDVTIAVGAGLAAWFLQGAAAVRRQCEWLLAMLERGAPWIAAAAAAATLAIGLLVGSPYAGGADSSGYLAQARLWQAGALHVVVPEAADAPWPNPEWTFSPLGFRPATYPGAIVPLYPPGLPLAMAAASSISRMPAAASGVVALFGAACVWLTFLIGRRLQDATTGMWGAALLAVNPVFLFQTLQPMSDVPATAWWLAASLGVLTGTARAAFLGGIAVSAAILTRPNLLPLTIVAGAWSAWCADEGHGRVNWRRTALFCAGALPGPLFVAWFNYTLYGSPLQSGYGDLADLFSPAHLAVNLVRYPAWLWQTHTVLVFAGLVAPALLIALRRSLTGEARRAGWYAFVMSAAVCLLYLTYRPFDDWTFLRFLLPAIALLTLLGIWLILRLAGRLHPLFRVALAVLLAWCAVDVARQAKPLGVMNLRASERRYAQVAEYVRREMPGRQIAIGLQHTGSLRYYAGTTTVRWDWLDPEWLDRTVDAIHRSGRGPFLLLEEWEEREVRERFRGQAWSALDWPPRVEFHTRPPVRLYDPYDREAFRQGRAVPTLHVAAK